MFIKRSKYQQIIDSYEETIRNAENVISQMHSKYDGIEDVDKEIICRRAKFEQEEQQLIRNNEEIITKGQYLQQQYDEAYKVYSNLKKSIELYSEQSEFLDFGIYSPIYSFNTEDEFKLKIEENHNKQKLLIKEKTAVLCDTQWRVIDERGYWSTAKGAAMINREVKLALRSFNGECDAIIAKVKWNNFEQSKKKIQDIFERLNKIQDFHQTHISEQYLDLKLEELTLTYEYELFRYKKKEEERERREELREEQKAIRELERERERAEKEETHYAAALAKVKKEIEKATGVQYDKLNERLQYLEEELATARANKERAISMAQQTRCGYVYIISNIGSFGDGVFKIGMTRRLDPEDRIRELSNASVPFKYDIHAMIYSEDAPALETLLHNVFDSKKINKVNGRKEFFKVSLTEIEDKIREQGLDAQFITIPEARDYRETLRMEEQSRITDGIKTTDNEYPNALFDSTFQI